MTDALATTEQMIAYNRLTRMKDFANAKNILVHTKSKVPLAYPSDRIHWVQCGGDPNFVPHFPLLSTSDPAVHPVVE